METFWTNKRVLITGHNGFKGSWLCLWLKKLGAKVCGFSLPDPPTSPSLYKLAKIDRDVELEWGDNISDFTLIKTCVKIVQPEIVFHMAAQTIVKDGFIDPLTTFKTNIIGTANLLQACIDVGSIKSIIVVTTDKVYEDKNWDWGYREGDPLGANDPYSTSKACAELIAAGYRGERSGKLPIATARAGNVVGGGDFSYRVLPMVYEALSKNESPPIWDPTAIRPWQYVLDCLWGYMLLAQKIYEDQKLCPRKYLGSWNFGPSSMDYYTVGVLVDKICSAWKDGSISRTKVTCPTIYPLGVDLRLDPHKAIRLLGWKPKYNIDYLVHVTNDWYERYYNGEDMRIISLYNIETWEEDE